MPPPLPAGIPTLLQPRCLTGTDGSWQTVTTNRRCESTGNLNLTQAKGVGSSLADVSDDCDYEMFPKEYGSTERIIQHPQHPQHHEIQAPYRIRNDKRANRPIAFSRARQPDDLVYPQNSSRHVRHPSARAAAAAVRRFSSSFRRDGSPQRTAKANKTFEMKALNTSYESLPSEPGHHWISEQTTVPDSKTDKTGMFRWSRIRQNLGRDSPKNPFTISEQPLYRPGGKEAAHIKKPSRVPHDDFLKEIPPLPFPLVSLPEAAMLQYFRRQRGEEDHTDPAGSFAGRKRHGTFSTISSSNGPRTPASARFRVHQDPSKVEFPGLASVRYGDAPHQVQRRRSCENSACSF